MSCRSIKGNQSTTEAMDFFPFPIHSPSPPQPGQKIPFPLLAFAQVSLLYTQCKEKSNAEKPGLDFAAGAGEEKSLLRAR